jgi:uncharacterized protein YbjT (DUF2867 family)
MILLTGATGLSGRAILHELARQKQPVRTLVRDLAKASHAGIDRLEGIELVEGDMLSPETLEAALEGIERVLMISTGNQQILETQCTFIDSCQRAGVAHIIKFSGAESGIGFDPARFRFTRMHEEIERYLSRSGLAWTNLRPSQFMQVYLREAPTVIAGGAIYLPFEDIRLSPIDIQDVAIQDVAKIASHLLRYGGHHGENLDMTGPEALTMTNIATRISQAIGKAVRYVPVSPEDRRRRLSANGISADFADALDEQVMERRKHLESRVYLKTHQTFGIQPTSFSAFLQRHIAVFRGEV